MLGYLTPSGPLGLTSCHLSPFTRHRLIIPVVATVAARVASGVVTIRGIRGIRVRVVAAVLRRSVVPGFCRTVLLRVLDLAAVAAGHALQHVAVLVQAGDLDAGVLQLVLHVHVGGEDDAASANQVGLHVLQVSHCLRADAEAHRSQTGQGYAVTLSGPRADYFTCGIPSRLDHACRDTAVGRWGCRGRDASRTSFQGSYQALLHVAVQLL